MGRKPQPGCRAESGAKFECHLRGNRTAAVDDAVDHLDVAIEVLRQGFLGEPEWLEELLVEDLAWRRGLAYDLSLHRADLPQWYLQEEELNDAAFEALNSHAAYTSLRYTVTRVRSRAEVNFMHDWVASFVPWDDVVISYGCEGLLGGSALPHRRAPPAGRGASGGGGPRVGGGPLGFYGVVQI